MNILSVNFPSPVVLEYYSNRNWKIAEDFHVLLDMPKEKVQSYVIRVPEGFTTDLASVPRELWALFPPEGRYTEAAVAHDYLYSTKGMVPGLTFQRSDADQVLLLGMKACGEGVVARRTIWSAVRVFGYSHW